MRAGWQCGCASILGRVDKRNPYASDDQVIAALEDNGHNRRVAAVSLGISERAIYSRIAKLKQKGIYDGGVEATVPEAHTVKGVSTLYGEDGSVRAQWIKTQQSAAEMAAAREEACRAMAESLPKEKPVKTRIKSSDDDLLNLYLITDFHLGMKSWGEESGADWDMKIAENLLVDWFAAAIKQAPNAGTAVFAQLGDFLHYDGLDAVTPTAHNVLDSDTRFQKVVRVAIRALRRIVRMLRQKHPYTHIIMAEGNHDMASSVWLRELFAAVFEGSDNVSVDLNPDPYYCYEFGDTSLFFHHGHKKRPNNIDDVFVAKFREVFGRTKHSYGHMGHLHHLQSIESNLMIVEQHRTLAAADAYASRGGWMSGRDASVITYHKRYGQVGRVTITPEMV